MQSINSYREYRDFFKKMLYSLKKEDSKIGTSFYAEFETVIKSQFILMLYTTTESIVMTSIQDIFDDIESKKYHFYNLSDQVKKIHLRFCIPNKERHINKIIENDIIDILSDIENEKIIKFSLFTNQNKENPFNAGSLDCKSIRKNILEKFGIDTITENTFGKHKKVVSDIQKIKEYRNQLAHGEKRFEEVGRNITVEDLIRYFLSWSMFLRQYTKNIKKYIDNESYKK